ncbi:Uncharacterized protein PBTT_03902 [Plasmodiophora brassicae]
MDCDRTCAASRGLLLASLNDQFVPVGTPQEMLPSDSLPMMALALFAGLAVDRATVDSSVVFPSAVPGSPLAGLALYAATLTSFVGPQPGDVSNGTRSGPVVLYSGDMCRPVGLHAPGSIIIVRPGSALDSWCSFETQYLAFYGTGASTVIWPMVDEVPSNRMYENDGSRGSRTRHLPMLYLQIGPSSDMLDVLVAHAPGQYATVYPDVNVWQATYASWYYQFFVRILPSTVLIGSGCLASVFLVLHMRLINARYKQDVPMARQSLARRITYVRHALGMVHAVLAIDAVTDPISGIVLAVGGFFSTPNLPHSVVVSFLTLLGGWSFVSALLSASVWIRQLTKIISSDSILTRVMRGDHPLAFALMLTIPVAVDTSISAFWYTYYYSDVTTGLAGAILFVFEITVGLHVLASVLRYFMFINDVHGRTAGVERRRPGMDALLARLSRYALGISLSLIMVCSGTALSAVSVRFVNSPLGWTLCFSLGYTGRALHSAFQVAMFRPKRFTGPMPASIERVTVVPDVPARRQLF